MKFVRFGEAGAERPGVIDAEGHIRDLGELVPDINGRTIGQLATLDDTAIASLPRVEPGVRIGPCIAGVGKIICIGLNYRDHARETGAQVPAEPIIFMKATSTITGPYDDVEIPRGSTKSDWEVELGIVIGKQTRYVSEADAAASIAGYCLINDLSEREFQLERGGQWTKGKCCDTFAPLGPWLVTADEVGDPTKLGMWLEVDGHRYQDSSTAEMIFTPAFLVHYLSQFMSLQPGDIISSGTPAGVGLGQDPPVFLVPGQTMRLGIDKLGVQQQTTRAYEGP